MPIGLVVTTLLLSAATAMAVAPPRPAHSTPGNPAYWLGFVVNELPLVTALALVASLLLAWYEGDLATPLGAVSVVLGVACLGALAIVARRGLAARAVIAVALSDALGRPPCARPGRWPGHPWWRLCRPLPLRPRNMVRTHTVAYADQSRHQRLDVHRPRRPGPAGPVLVYFHGGAFRGGSKRREGLPLLHGLARRGWTCVSADYRRAPAVPYADQLADARRAIAWSRHHLLGRTGADVPLLVAGSSAGGHLAAAAALTASEPGGQPGPPTGDASTDGCVVLYGYFGTAEPGSPSSPLQLLHPDAPPFFVLHGDHDTLVLVDDARCFVAELRARSRAPVVYAELPGAQHTFDLFHSARTEAVVDGVACFGAAAIRRTGA